MATTTNYGWTTPDDTALVKDGASAIRTLGSSVDTTTKALNPSTTLGDIEYRSSTANTNTRLGIGSTGQVLTVAGGVPSWAAPAGGGANWSLLNSGGTALTGAQTITVSGISGKSQIMILVDGGSTTSTTSPEIGFRLNTDTGNNYAQFGTEFFGADGSYTPGTLDVLTKNYIYFAKQSSASAAKVFCGAITLTGCNSAGVKAFQTVGGSETGTNRSFVISQGYYNSATVISSISLFTENDTFDAGTVYVYTSA
jgi:hypothetical protein